MKKLIRDHIPGLDYDKNVEEVDKDEAFVYLIFKLQEEILELQESAYRDIYEYADVLETLMSIAKAKKVKWRDVEVARKIKLKERGGFSNKILTIKD